MENKFVIGKVLKPQGIKGEIKVDCFLQDAEYFRNLKSVFVGATEHSVETVSVRNGFAFIKLEDVKDCNGAELLRNLEIWVRKEDAPKLEEDEFFIDDLVGCKLVDENEITIGHVESVEKYGAADIINIIGKRGLQSFPFVKDIANKIDIENKTIYINTKRFEEVVVWELIS